MLASTPAGLLILATFTGILFVWAYAYVFNHTFIRTYSATRTIPLHDINLRISADLNRAFGFNLPAVTSTESEKSFHFVNESVGSTSSSSSLHDSIVASVFAASISLGIMLIVLMMCELSDTGNAASRLAFFHLTIGCLVSLLACIQPFLILSIFLNDSLVPQIRRYFRLIVFTFACGLWLLFLSKCGRFQGVSQATHLDYHPKSLIERKTSEVAMVGITFLAILSGIGCVSTPYKVFQFETILRKALGLGHSGYDFNKKLSLVKIAELILSYNNMSFILDQRYQSLARIRGDASLMASDSLNHRMKLPGILARVPSLADLREMAIGGKELEMEGLVLEINLLKLLRCLIYEDLSRSITKFIRQENALNSHSGRLNRRVLLIFNLSYQAFACYCVYRIINVVLLRIPMRWMRGGVGDEISISTTGRLISDADEIQGPQTQSQAEDALATTIAKLILSIGNLPVTEALLINVLSFALSGGLFLCTFSNVLVTFRSFARFIPQSAETSADKKNWLKHLIIAELVGVYTLATALLIRTNLPSNLSHQVSKLLSLSGALKPTPLASAREVEYINYWFDKVFAITCICTFFLLVLKWFIGDDRKDTETFDEEMYVENDSAMFKSA